MRALTAALLVLSALLVPVAYAAYYGEGATVISASLQRQELADGPSTVADVSRDGRFAVFETRASNFFADTDPDPSFTEPDGSSIPTDRQGGIFRRPEDGGGLELVADGDLVDERDSRRVLIRGARNPSISGDGRFVAFSTAQRLVPEDTDERGRFVDVYVRDMAIGLCRPLPECPGERNPYTLVSALDGGGTPITYAPPAEPAPAGNNGSDVAPRASISDDGARVAFRTVENASDAPGPPVSAPGVPVTEPGQLLVRDLTAQATTLVTRVRGGRPDEGRPAGGAVGASQISGDGTTVVWSGRNAGDQTRFQPGEDSDPNVAFYLWRRVADGPDAATRRITGVSDPDDPACSPDETIDASNASATGPCYGPLTATESFNGSVIFAPVGLSADGYDVAYTTGTLPRGSGQIEGSAADLFTTSMRPGLSRKQATRELTREGVGDLSASGAISDVSMSPDGRHVALVTSRNRFALPALRLTGATRANSTIQDLYLVDRDAGTIERVLLGLRGADPNADVGVGLSVAEGARRIAFTTAATNLFVGDANQASDAFVIGEQSRPGLDEPPPEPERLPEPSTEVEPIPDEEPPVLPVRVLRGLRTGDMRIEVRPPGDGTIVAAASTRLPGRDGRRRASTPLKVVARAKAPARAGRPKRLTLRLARKQRSRLRRLRRLTTSAQVVFTPRAPGARALRRSVTVRFQVIRPKSRPAKKRRSGRRSSAAKGSSRSEVKSR